MSREWEVLYWIVPEYVRFLAALDRIAHHPACGRLGHCREIGNLARTALGLPSVDLGPVVTIEAKCRHGVLSEGLETQEEET